MKSSDLMGYVVLIALATMVGIFQALPLWRAVLMAFIWLGIMEVIRKYL
jgi:hypothetical protein